MLLDSAEKGLAARETREQFGPLLDHLRSRATIEFTKGELGAYGLAERSDRIARPENLIWVMPA